MKLNIGAGKDLRIGWKNTDKEEDLFTMVRDEETVDAILLNHVAMYIRPEDMRSLLNRWFKWLVIGGTLHIETQDLDKVKDPETLYGMGENAGHKWGWTPETLGKLMEEAGFKVSCVPGILHGRPERDFLIAGKKYARN